MKRQELKATEFNPRPGDSCQVWVKAIADENDEFNLKDEGVLDFFYPHWLDGNLYVVISMNQKYLLHDVFGYANQSVNFEYVFTKIPEKKDTFKSSHREGVEL